MTNYHNQIIRNQSINRNSCIHQNLTNNRSKFMNDDMSYEQNMSRFNNNIVYSEHDEVIQMVDNRLQNLLLYLQT